MNSAEFHLGIFTFGCIGALAPEIVRLYNLRTKPHFVWSWFYVLISLLFALLGGILAWILPSTTYHGAFYTGVAAPIIVTTVKRNAQGQDNDEITAQSAPSTSQKLNQGIGQLFRNYWQAL